MWGCTALNGNRFFSADSGMQAQIFDITSDGSSEHVYIAQSKFNMAAWMKEFSSIVVGCYYEPSGLDQNATLIFSDTDLTLNLRAS